MNNGTAKARITACPFYLKIAADTWAVSGAIRKLSAESQQGRIPAMDIIPVPPAPLTIGQLANTYAASNVFQEYQEKMATNTLKRHQDDLALFSQFLKHAGMSKDHLMSDCAEWSGITFGLVEAFKRWQLEQGYAIASINAHLSTVKVYAKLAVKAGILSF